MKHIFLILFLSCLAACGQKENPYPDIIHTDDGGLCLSSDDSTLVEIFRWASRKSQSYVGSDTDPVGPWYEAALPEREAFCMRDISHQCIGEEINGHGRQNRNMFTRFVENISEEKDYCTYWEINKDNLPAPMDYENDQDFWYNLNANFDVLAACYRLYLWTGDRTYIDDPRFLAFFRQTCNEYMECWQLEAERIMSRPAVMNVRGDVARKRFKGVRGLPSYEESVPHLKVTGDLLATMYRGLHSYAAILSLRGETDEADVYRKKADSYAALYDSLWWNAGSGNYYSYCLDDGSFREGGTNSFTAWFGMATQPERLRSILHLMETKETNVETMSYYPAIFYRYACASQGYRCLQSLFANGRRDYPEVSSSILEGIVCGAAGVRVDAGRNTVTTCPQLTAATSWLAIENIPALGGKISVIHYNNKESGLCNKTGKAFVWQAAFAGKVSISQDGKPLPVEVWQDALGNTFSYAAIECRSGETLRVRASE